MRIDARQLVVGVLIAGVAGGFLFLPALVYVGTFLSPTQIAPVTTHATPLLADALWAKANGGRATTLEPIDPFTLGRMAACHLLAERIDDRDERQLQHDECMKLMPGVQAVGYVASVHLRSEGVWQDPRVPFVQIATMTRIADTWTRAELVDTLAERGEFPDGSRGVEQAAHRYFGRAASDLTVPQAALLAAMIGDRRGDPWCAPEPAAATRRRILDRMHQNLAIDDAAYRAALTAPLGLIAPPEDHKPCAP